MNINLSMTILPKSEFDFFNFMFLLSIIKLNIGVVNKTHGFNQRLTYKMSLQFFALLYDRASYNFNISYWVVKWTEVVDITKIIEDMTFCSHCENRTRSHLQKAKSSR